MQRARGIVIERPEPPSADAGHWDRETNGFA
jgi:hypothetical protein